MLLVVPPLEETEIRMVEPPFKSSEVQVSVALASVLLVGSTLPETVRAPTEPDPFNALLVFAMVTSELFSEAALR